MLVTVGGLVMFRCWLFLLGIVWWVYTAYLPACRPSGLPLQTGRNRQRPGDVSLLRLGIFFFFVKKIAPLPLPFPLGEHIPRRYFSQIILIAPSGAPLGCSQGVLLRCWWTSKHQTRTWRVKKPPIIYSGRRWRVRQKNWTATKRLLEFRRSGNYT